MGITGIYEGHLTYHGGSFTVLSYPSGIPAASADVQVNVHKDDAGREFFAISLSHKLVSQLFLDEQGQYEISNGKVNLRPQQESSGPVTLGFILPPTAMRSFAHAPNPGHPLPGQPCDASTSGCQTLAVPISFSGTVLQCRYEIASNKISFVFDGHQRLLWSFEYSGSQKELPAKIGYSEWNADGSLGASATFTLLSSSTDAAPLSKATILPAGSHIDVFKGPSGYGPLPQRADPWDFYKSQQAAWAQRDQRLASQGQHVPWFAVSLLTTALIVAAVILILRKR